MSLIKHIAPLHIVIPFLGAMLAGLSFNKKVAWKISQLSILIVFSLSIYSLGAANETYIFGEWPKEGGIEFILKHFDRCIILFLNFILLIFLCFNCQIIQESILNFIKVKWQFLFFSLILFAHAGYIGIICTNDLFNLYVFIEISSLSSYVLIALGGNNKASIGALYYLIFGSIGATLILIAIGFLYAITGNLNFDEVNHLINENLLQNYQYKIALSTAIAFYISGTLLKISFFPIHFWRKQAYTYTSETLLIYLASISSIIGIYILIKFLVIIYSYESIITLLRYFILPLTSIGILICSYLAIKANKLNLLIIYGVLLNICYAILFLFIKDGENLVIPIIIVDGLNKAGLFSLQAYFNSKYFPLNHAYLWKYLTVILIICSTGLPLTPMFLIKFIMIKALFIDQQLYILFIILISFVISIIYHYKIAKILLTTQINNVVNKVKPNYTLLLIIFGQIILFFNFTKLLILGSFL